MLFEVTCAFVNKKGNIEMHTNTFAAKSAINAKVDAQEYFPEAFCNGKDYIYSEPVDVSETAKPYNMQNIRVMGRNVQIGVSPSSDMVQINHGQATGVQINGNADSAMIVTGDGNVNFISKKGTRLEINN